MGKLGLGGGDGDFTPFIKYNAKAGRFYIRNEEGVEIEVVNPRLVFDFEHIKVGWIRFPEGMPPEKVWNVVGAPWPARPPGGKEWKMGFEVMVFGPEKVGSTKIGLREFASNANLVGQAIDEMYDTYAAVHLEYMDELPIFQCSSVEPIAGKYGTNYKPIFTLTGWVPKEKVPELVDANKVEEQPKSTSDELNDDIPF